MSKFIKERNRVLISGDEKRIRKFFKEQNGFDMSDDPVVFWASVHKAITGAKGISLRRRRASKKWLDDNGFTSHDDGELES